MKKAENVLKEVLKKVSPPEKELDSINKYVKSFMSDLEKRLKKTKTSAEVFVGGSFAKGTMIKKGQYDIDVFVRFSEKCKEKDISKLTEKVLNGMRLKITKIHGSRDYFRINVNSVFFIEVIPVIKIKNPKQAENITDLSYFHVNYVKKKLKTEKALEEVRLAKAFCHANKCYGAESYISGFSGYALELLIYHYKSFLGFVKGISKIKEKEVIDIERFYKSKYEIAMNMNSAKMLSPIVLVDPTYKERNALAALSKETFEKFQEACRKFLKNPSEKDFELKEVDIGTIKKNAERSKHEFILLNVITDKPAGDVAGSKLLKFFRHLGEEIEKPYKISNKGFDYQGTKEAEYFFVVKKKENLIQRGPHLRDKENVKIFKKHHKSTFVKDNVIYAKEKVEKNIKEFIRSWISNNAEKMKAMRISNLEIVNF